MIHRSHLLAFCLALMATGALAFLVPGASRAQAGPTVRSEHWPELGLDPQELLFDNGLDRKSVV